jgi:preprotein translocase subunit SecG
MHMLILGSWLVSVLALLFCGVALLMVLLILVQKPKGGGLAGAFGGGGGGGGQGAFGAKVGDVLTWATVVFFVAFLLLAMGLTWTIRPEQERRRTIAEPAGAPTAPPATAPLDLEPPAAPNEPATPVEGDAPAVPATPVEPTAPVEGDEPTTPVDPATPAAPAAPADIEPTPPTE